ncbi:MAG: hypothetical protein ABIZ80_25775 [Bryobacteraceae bacterium]
MKPFLPALALTLAFAARAYSQPGEPISRMTSRLAEEAEAFARTARSVFAEETLRQRTLGPQSRFRPRVGAGANVPAKPSYRTREIVSEYGYSSLQEAPASLQEFRQVVRVDGRKVLAPGKARATLSFGLNSPRDQEKKKMLQEFEKYGLNGAAVDFGQVILLFTKRRLADYEFTPARMARLGADEAIVLTFRQTGGTESLTVFSGRHALRQKLSGEVWLRRQDFLPLRITLTAGRDEAKQHIRTEASVDYTRSAHGIVVPASVVYKETIGGELVSENIFRYSAFRRFGAESDVKFTEIPAPN